jgi:hypothetical protein
MESIKKLAKPLILIISFFPLMSIVYGFWLSLQIVHIKLGLFAAILSFIFAPLTIVIVPLWSGFGEGYWMPAIYSFTPLLIFMFLTFIFMSLIFILKKMGLNK